jgi:hypothetical protein
MAWFAEARQAWIKETIYIFGFINREHIERKFRVTTAVASKDIQQFITNNPGSLTYNKSDKRYEATSR